MNRKTFYHVIVGYSLLIVLGSLIFATLKEAQRQKECPCNEAIAKEIAAIYVLSNPINESQNFPVLISRLRESYPDLNNKSDLVRCMRVIGKKFLIAGYQPFMDHEIAKRRIYQLGIETRVTLSVYERTYNDLMTGNIDLYNFGRELIWLSNVLPCAVRGDSILYFKTGTQTRNAIRSWMPCLEGMMMDDPLTGRYIDEAFKEHHAEYYSLIEDQMAIYCMLAGYE